MSEEPSTRPYSTLDEVRAQMSDRRRQLPEPDDSSDAPTDVSDDVADDVEETVAAAFAWGVAREQAYVSVEPVTQRSLVDFLR